MIPPGQTCQVCGAPATRVIYDVSQIPDDSFWYVEADDDPWYFCDEHAEGESSEQPK